MPAQGDQAPYSSPRLLLWDGWLPRKRLLAAMLPQLQRGFVRHVHLALLQDFRSRNDCRARMVDAFADFSRLVPALPVLNVSEPPGISAALGWARLVDGAGVVGE